MDNDWYFNSEYRKQSAQALQDKYDRRQMSRDEYQFWCRVERTDDCWISVPYLDNWLELDDPFTHHLYLIGDAVKQRNWPAHLQYHAVSAGYSAYLGECLGDLAGDEYIREIEEATSRYLNGEYLLYCQTDYPDL